MHLLLDGLQVLVADPVCLVRSGVDDVPHLVDVLLVVMASLPHWGKHLIHPLHQELLAGNASDFRVPAH